ncbi:unnamed protein product [Adineta ricciae]|uniref:G-protein coupled receptors family 1 profile domain-containing protein n=1 Tax=Adineta ricciae TaxID=249248 RepID=A0A814X4N8_ADIRI|nr:unnamed protein product [Adineta ricciae]CAF1314014.1 unnamed protein product [Adineta ricciae]
MYVLSQMITYYTLGPLLLIIFGILTIINTHRHARVRVVPHNSGSSGRRTKGQLARMLLLKVCCHLILTTPFGVIYFLNALDPSTRTSNITAIRYICVLWAELDCFVSFFLYILSRSLYREELRRLFKFIQPQNHIKITIRHQQVENKPTA